MAKSDKFKAPDLSQREGESDKAFLIRLSKMADQRLIRADISATNYVSCIAWMIQSHTLISIFLSMRNKQVMSTMLQIYIRENIPIDLG